MAISSSEMSLESLILVEEGKAGGGEKAIWIAQQEKKIEKNTDKNSWSKQGYPLSSFMGRAKEEDNKAGKHWKKEVEMEKGRGDADKEVRLQGFRPYDKDRDSTTSFFFTTLESQCLYILSPLL